MAQNQNTSSGVGVEEMFQALLVLMNVAVTVYQIYPAGALVTEVLVVLAALIGAGNAWIPVIVALGKKPTWIIIAIFTVGNIVFGAGLYFKPVEPVELVETAVPMEPVESVDPCVSLAEAEQIIPADFESNEVLILVSDFYEADDAPFVSEPGNYLYSRFEDLATEFNTPGSDFHIRVEKLDELLEDEDRARVVSDCFGSSIAAFGRVTSVDVHFYYLYTRRLDAQSAGSNNEWDLMFSNKEMAVEYTLNGGSSEGALRRALWGHAADVLTIDFELLGEGFGLVDHEIP